MEQSSVRGAEYAGRIINYISVVKVVNDTSSCSASPAGPLRLRTFNISLLVYDMDIPVSAPVKRLECPEIGLTVTDMVHIRMLARLHE